jgi:2-oxoglutarate ferredoxin oxidoreductase subunit delta
MKSALADFIGGDGVVKKAKKKKTAAIVINKDFCKGCGICVAFCPAHVLELGEDEKAFVKRLEDCTACGLCEMRCPDIAIEVQTEAEKSEEPRAESVEQRA